MDTPRPISDVVIFRASFQEKIATLDGIREIYVPSGFSAGSMAAIQSPASLQRMRFSDFT